jgi:hypothetical protein
MTRVKLIATACATALMAVLSVNVAAQDFNTNERTFLTFSNTVELPGATLPAGTYLFKLADSPSNRHIVQVLSQDEKQIHATILAVPAERAEVSGENVVTFRETAESATPAVQYWYYPGDRIGHEFVYPKDQAMKIAKRTGQDVLSTDGDVASSESTVSSMGPDGQASEWKHEEQAAQPAQTAQAESSSTVQGTTGVAETPKPAEPEKETVAPQAETVNPETETPPAEPTAPQQPAPRATAPAAPQDSTVGTSGTSGRASELPATASPLPLSGLIGLLALGGAAVLRRVRR